VLPRAAVAGSRPGGPGPGPGARARHGQRAGARQDSGSAWHVPDRRRAAAARLGNTLSARPALSPPARRGPASGLRLGCGLTGSSGPAQAERTAASWPLGTAVTVTP
jgi:hypothetical protein